MFGRLPVHRDVNRLVGDFTTTLLLEVDLAAGSSFADNARRVQAQLWRDFDHRHYSGVHVVRDYAQAQGRNVAGAMPVVFTSALHVEQGRPEDMFGEFTSGVSQTPQVWLDHQIYEVAGGLQMNFDYVSELFPAGMMEDMFGSYVRLLHELAATAGSWQQPVGGLVPASHVALVQHINDTAWAPLSPSSSAREEQDAVRAAEPCGSDVLTQGSTARDSSVDHAGENRGNVETASPPSRRLVLPLLFEEQGCDGAVNAAGKGYKDFGHLFIS